MNRITAEQETQQSYALIDMAMKSSGKKDQGIRVSEWIKNTSKFRWKGCVTVR